MRNIAQLATELSEGSSKNILLANDDGIIAIVLNGSRTDLAILLKQAFDANHDFFDICACAVFAQGACNEQDGKALDEIIKTKEDGKI